MKEVLRHEILEFHPDTRDRVLESCGLDGPGRMEEAVDRLQEWIEKQEHLLKKDFSRKYLESTLHMSKGLVEKSKQRIDMICTIRTFVPQFLSKLMPKMTFPKNSIMLGESSQVIKAIFLPKLTDDHYRVGVLKLSSKHYPTFFQELYQYVVIICEYAKLTDCCKGFIFIVDPTDINIMEFITKINLIELRDIAVLVTKAYGARIKSIHLVTPSKAAEIFLSMAKQVVSAKITSRISIQKTMEEVHQYVPKRIMPEDMGGEEKHTDKLHAKWLDVYTSEEHLQHLRDMQDARTDESRRREELDDAMFGLPGTFRALDLD